MNDAPPPPPPPPLEAQSPTKKGGSPLVYVGIGCGVLAVLAVVGFVVTLQWGLTKAKVGLDQLKTTAAEFEKNPGKVAAELAVTLNPDLELVNSDETKGQITFRYKKTGATGTISYEDAAQGKFTLDPGKTSFTFKAGQPVPLPAWVPILPGLETGDGSVRTVSDARESVQLLATINRPVNIVAAFYNKRLTEAGFTVTSQQQTAGTFATHRLQAKDDAGRRSMTVAITQEEKNAPTAVVIVAEGPVAEK